MPRFVTMRPVRDPLNCLICSGTAGAVRDVFAGSEQMVRERVVQSIDQNDALDRLQEGRNRALERVPDIDWAKRRSDEISPFCLPVRRDASIGISATMDHA